MSVETRHKMDNVHDETLAPDTHHLFFVAVSSFAKEIRYDHRPVFRIKPILQP
jgi:hypothetical protein